MKLKTFEGLTRLKYLRRYLAPKNTPGIRSDCSNLYFYLELVLGSILAWEIFGKRKKNIIWIISGHRSCSKRVRIFFNKKIGKLTNASVHLHTHECSSSSIMTAKGRTGFNPPDWLLVHWCRIFSELAFEFYFQIILLRNLSLFENFFNQWHEKLFKKKM